MSIQSPGSEQDYERMILSQGKKKLRIRLNPSRCGDLILLGLLSVAVVFSAISLISQSISFEVTRVVTGSNLTCTLFVEYTQQQTLSSPSPTSCYSAIGMTTFILVGLLTHCIFISVKCCFHREWRCVEALHTFLGLLLLLASIATSILLVLGFQQTCNSLIAANTTCELISGVPYRDLMRQAPVSLWIVTILILFVEIIFIVRTNVYFYKCVQTGKFRKNGNCCLDCSKSGRSLRNLLSH